MEAELEERFWAHVEKGEPDECWLWRGPADSHPRTGYGYFSFCGRKLLAHRVAYEIANGSYPDGTVTDHLCRTRLCVNPAHLEAVSNVTNVMRGESFAAQNARKTHCSKGHEFTPENTYTPKTGGRQCLTCTKAYSRAYEQTPKGRAAMKARRARRTARERAKRAAA